MPFEQTMATPTIRSLEDSVKARLRVQAAMHGRSMEEEARHILREAVGPEATAPNLADLAVTLSGGHGAELEPHPAVEPREPPELAS